VRIPEGVKVVCDEDYVPTDRSFVHGWMQQQVCKLMIHRLGFADSFLVVDSDAYFVAPVTEGHFSRDGKPAIVYSDIFTKVENWNGKLVGYLNGEVAQDLGLTQGSLRLFDRQFDHLKEWFALDRARPPMDSLPRINDVFGTPQGLAFQPGQIFHSAHLEAFERFFGQRGVSIFDLIAMAPWEYNWYACWVSAALGDEVARTTSYTLHFGSDDAVSYAQSIGLTAAQIASKFSVVQMAARHMTTEVYSLHVN
jgi:hypothetical protein